VTERENKLNIVAYNFTVCNFYLVSVGQ